MRPANGLRADFRLGGLFHSRRRTFLRREPPPPDIIARFQFDAIFS
jgi:hypothetical protein